MIALILNSGLGRRMGALTGDQPKCMTEIAPGVTILSRQLSYLAECGIEDVVMTTGLFDQILIDYCHALGLPLRYTFVNNPRYDRTNYIYSIYLARDYLNDEIVLMHGDLVFSLDVLQDALSLPDSCMTVSSTLPLPEKDFKAVIDQGLIRQVGVHFFDHAVAAQPLYHLRQLDWRIWLDAIISWCESGKTDCYAENALNEVSAQMRLLPLDVGDRLCGEIDTPDDLVSMRERLAREKLDHAKEQIKRARPSVYMCFSTDLIHGGHIAIIQKAAVLGDVTVGMLTDEVIASYKRFPILGYDERVKLLEGIKGICRVVPQTTLSYRSNLLQYRPDIVVHGDDWRTGLQKPIRDEVIEALAAYGGQLVEFPYAVSESYRRLEQSQREQLAMPDVRRKRLKQLLAMKPLVTAIEAHSGITGLIAEKTTVLQDGKTFQFDAMWCSSLCDSTARGKPDIELLDMSTRLRTIDEIMDVTTKPIILDGDTGGLTEHFIYTVRTLERMGVSAVIIEDKTGLKKNSLFGTDVEQTQEAVESFCHKIRSGKAALKTRDFMIIARIESLILDKGLDDALGRAQAYVQAGADGIMIHSRKRDPDEIFTFCARFRAHDPVTPIIVVPTTFNSVTEDEFASRGVNLVIYANHLTRSGFPAMQHTAETILRYHRALEADSQCMSIKEILTLIPEE